MFQHMNVQNDVRLSTVETGSCYEKPLGNIHVNSQSDRQVYLSNSDHCDGKPSGETSQEIACVQTYVVNTS